MWKAKLDINHDCVFGNACQAHQAKVSVVTTNAYEEENAYYAQHLGVVIEGPQEAFLNDLQDDERITYFERDGSTFFVREARQTPSPGSHYDHRIIYVHPPIGHKDGSETWVIAAVQRSTLTGFIEAVRDDVKILNLSFIEEASLKDIYFTKLDPGLTEKQRSHLLQAVQRGYYDHPRGTSLTELADETGVARSTYTESLRAAERKTLGAFFNPSYDG